MSTHNSNKIVLPVFAGLGITRTSLNLAADQAIRDADSPAGSLFLSSCLDVFRAELAALSPTELVQSGICPSDFDEPRRLLIPHPKYAKNHITSRVFLFLTQVLRFQSYVQTTSCSFPDLLKANIDRAAGVLGLSSGIFPACVVAASRSPLSYITTALEIFRLVFWIALRVVQFTRKLLEENPVDDTLPWSVVCLGLTKTDVEQHIAQFEQKHCGFPSLRVTAVLDERNVTVTGRPDLLVQFSTFLSQHCTVRPTTLDAPYHSDLHLSDTRDRILADILERNIQFPDYRDLHCPLRSTISGDIVRSSSNYPSLVDLVVDMVLVLPVNWDLIAKKVASVVPADVGLLAVNIGPGSNLLRTLERVAPDCILHCIDATLEARTEVTPTPAKQEPIAIIGMAARTPGAANTGQLWEVLERGLSTISKIPDDRFGFLLRPAADAGLPRCEMRVKTGNFMDDFADFDHKFFKISPREARSMEPQQRVLLHTAYEALENAGYVPDATPSFQRATFGCYVGALMQEYTENLANSNNIDIHYVPGNARAFLSGRISYTMQFGGPSLVVDTACSASIVAIHQACRALMSRDCDAALAGGINIMTSLNTFAGLERGHFLSPSGQGKPFDASADGYSRGEGCCLFVLKRLSDAMAENDNILGVIRGIELNQNGLASSITHPHIATLADLLKTLLEHSRLSPTCVSVVEAHCAGTQAGDPSELASIRSVLSQGRTQHNPLHVTSIKANIGNLEAASGAVGLCKLLLMLRHSIIPAQISLKTLHPLITPMDVDNTVINTTPVPWVAESTPRVAVLNNFGAAGSNGALILEEYMKPRQPPKSSSFVFGISAKSAGALETLRSRYRQWLSDAQNQNVPFGDIAYTATARRQLYPFRLAVAAKDRDQLVRALDATPITHLERHGGHVIFVFSGQGSQYLNMGDSLYATSPVFRSCIDRCQHCLLSLGYPGILPIISSGTCDYVLGTVEEVEAYQCAILAVEYALVTLWKHWGVIPAAVIGQSLGEYAAMVTADVLSIETALSIVAKRARLMSQECAMGKTGMISITLPSMQVQEILTANASFPNVTIACVNTDSSCVVSGPVGELRTFAAQLKHTHGCKVVTLQVPLGFHSSAMDPILHDLRGHVATLPIHPPSIAIASNVYGTVVPVGDSSTFQADYFVKHCRQPVLFAQGLRELGQYMGPSQIDAWIDVGPHAICLPMIEATLSLSRETLCLPSMLKESLAWDTLMGSLAKLYRTTVPVDWRRVFGECTTCSCVDLPSYPFDSQKFWVPHINLSRAVHPISPELTIQPHIPDHPMLSSCPQLPSRQNGNAAIFETPISCLATYMEGHKVGGYALCPASVYLELALAGATITQHHMESDFGRCMPVLCGVEFSRPLVFHQEVHLVIGVHITVHEDGTGSFNITSRLESSREEHVHVQGDLHFSSIRETSSSLASELPGIFRRAEVLACKEISDVFTTRTAYEVIFPRVIKYAKGYHTIKSLTLSGDGASGIAHIALSSSLGVQPVFFDTMLHVAGFMVNMQCDTSDGYTCSGVGSLKVLRDLVTDKQPYTIYCTENWTTSHEFVTADILAVQECIPPVVVAQIQDARFRRVRLTSLHRDLAIAGKPRGIQGHRGTTNSTSIVRDRVRMIIAEILGLADSKDIQDEADFGSLGLDSFGSIEARKALGVAFDRPIPHNIFIKCTTLSALCDFLMANLNHHEVDVLDIKDRGGETPDVALVSLHQCPDTSRPLPQTLVSENGGISSMDAAHVHKIIAKVLGLADSEEIQDEADFGSLGLDSFGSIEAREALRVAFNRPIPHNIFIMCPTLSALRDFLGAGLNDHDLDAQAYRGGGSPDVALVSLQRCLDTLRLTPQAPVPVNCGISRVNVDHVRKIIAKVLGMADSEIQDDADFGSLGLDSFGSIEAREALRVAFNRPIPHNIFTRCLTLSALCDFLGADLNDHDLEIKAYRGGVTPSVALVPLQQCSNTLRPPLFLVHDGSGVINHYERLLPLHRVVWGLSNPRFFCDESWETLEDMAQAYSLAIEKHAKSTALILGGWSFGGVVAFEIARILASRGVEVKGVVLIDSPSPLSPPLLSDTIIEHLFQDQERAVNSSAKALVIRQFKQNMELLDKYVPSAPTSAEISLAFLCCTAGFSPAGVDNVPAWFRERDRAASIVGPWEGLIRRSVPVWDIPGHHFEPFSTVHVKETSAQLARACRYLDTLQSVVEP